MSMSTGIPSAWAILAGALLVASCSQDPSSGASTETTNGIFGRLADTDSSPAAGAEVSIWDAQGERQLASVVTDSHGFWRAPLPPGNYGIFASTRDSQKVDWRFHTRSDTDTVRLALSAPAAATVPTTDKIRLLGTPFRAKEGRFARIPGGAYTIATDTDNGFAALGSFRVQSGMDDSILIPLRDSGVLLEDFDDSDAAFLYKASGPKGDWSMRLYGLSPSDGILFPASQSIADAITSRYAWNGKSLKVEYQATHGSIVQIALGFHRAVDLTKLRSIRLRTKGNAPFRVVVGAINQDGFAAWAGWSEPPRPEWTTSTLRPDVDMIQMPSYSPWSNVAPSATRFTIELLGMGTPAQIMIDDIRFDGVDAAAFLP